MVIHKSYILQYVLRNNSTEYVIWYYVLNRTEYVLTNCKKKWYYVKLTKQLNQQISWKHLGKLLMWYRRPKNTKNMRMYIYEIFYVTKNVTVHGTAQLFSNIKRVPTPSPTTSKG